MSRPALTRWLVTAAVAVVALGAGPHVDPTLLPVGCASCHEGHGVSQSPMLPQAQSGVCLQCHDAQAGVAQMVQQGRLAPHASPPLLGPALARPYRHRLDDALFSFRQSGVTCTSCHSPHREMPARASEPGQKKLSPKDPNRFEYELCLSCHGGIGPAPAISFDIGALLDPINRSYHPVIAPAQERSPSVLPSLSQREVNCTDCHGNSDRSSRGPHGSSVPSVLRAAYVTVDGGSSMAGYSLCFGCHEEQAILDESSSFPEHRKHIEGENTSCATCHNAHGSSNNRSLIRFGGETFLTGVAPSPSTQRLEFVSTSPGAGACYLLCHGEDHGPETYGEFSPVPPVPGATASRIGPTPGSTPTPPATPGGSPSPPARRRLIRSPPP